MYLRFHQPQVNAIPGYHLQDMKLAVLFIALRFKCQRAAARRNVKAYFALTWFKPAFQQVNRFNF